MKKTISNTVKIAALVMAASLTFAGCSKGKDALVIQKQGVFTSGGSVTEPVAGNYAPEKSWLDQTRAGNTAHIDHANTFYQIPAGKTKNPIVYLHGYGQSRTGWQTTPDGREGWSDIFLRKGYPAFLVDQPRRASAGSTSRMASAGGIDAWGEMPAKFPTFNGEVYLSNVVTGENEAGSPGMHYVVFPEGIYNAWHSHEGGQILIVTDGTGYHQIKGGQVEELHVGDVAFCPPDHKHWHGGSLYGTFAHIAINTNPEKPGVTWYEMMSEEDYRKITQGE